MVIEGRKGRKNKINVFSDGEYALTVDVGFWFTHGFHCGQEISPEEYELFKLKAMEHGAYDKALYLLSSRDRSANELEDKLSLKFGKTAARAAVSKARNLNLVDDETFAKKLSEELFYKRGFSPSRICLELKQRGITGDLARETAASIDFNPQERIIELVRTKFSRHLRDESGKQRLFAALARLGYSCADIRSALRALDIETGDEHDILD